MIYFFVMLFKFISRRVKSEFTLNCVLFIVIYLNLCRILYGFLHLYHKAWLQIATIYIYFMHIHKCIRNKCIK